MVRNARFNLPDDGIDLSKFEVLPFQYWSTRKVIASSPATTYDFFSYAQANPHPDGGTATLNDTNLKKERSIETPNKFYLQTISVLVSGVPIYHPYIANTAHADNILRTLLTDCIWTFRIGDTLKSYGQLEDLIHPSQIFGNVKLCKGVRYVVKPRPFLLQPENSFSFNLTYRNAPAPLADCVLKVVFGGRLLRPVGN